MGPRGTYFGKLLDLLLNTEIRNPTLRDFRVDPGTETKYPR
jgi:hypothetical protein